LALADPHGPEPAQRRRVAAFCAHASSPAGRRRFKHRRIAEGELRFMGAETLSLGLTVASGLLWTIAYLDAIRLGFRDKT
jgi:hypothetical protein